MSRNRGTVDCVDLDGKWLLLILAGLRDMFHTLFHPSGSGSLSDGLAKVDWRVFPLIARRRPSIVDRAGPTVLVAVITAWTALQAFGRALLYWQHLPNEFRVAS